MRKKSNKNGWVVFILAATVFGMLGLGNLFAPSRPASYRPGGENPPQETAPAPAASQSRDLALSCTSDALTKFHVHQQLAIIINGKKQIVPANIGITPQCMRVIHTHDKSGTIHIESPAAEDFTLGDFFAVWGKTFSKNQILDYEAGAGHEIVMTVDGRPSGDYENLILRDGQNIVIEYEPLAR